MALGAALVDRARVIRQTGSPVRVEGSTLIVPLHGPWFRCRLTLGRDGESQDRAGMRRVVRGPTLLFGVKDASGERIDVRATDRIEVESAALGTATWEVVSSLEPLRKKRSVIGYQASLRRIDQDDVTRPL